MEKNRTTVRIAGNNYSMSGYDTEDYMRRVALYVDRKIQEIAVTTRRSMQDTAVLTAVTLADDLFKAQDEISRLRRELNEAHIELEEFKSRKTGEDEK